MAWSYGLKTKGSRQTGGVYVTKIEDGDYLKVRNVDFGSGPKMITVRAASGSEGGRIEIRLNNPEGNIIGIVDVKYRWLAKLEKFFCKNKESKRSS